MEVTNRIVIVDKYTLVADAIKKALELELGLDVRGILRDASCLLASYNTLRPDMAVLGIYKPYTLELQAARGLKAAFPNLKVIVLTTNENARTAASCVDSWASAYLDMKSVDELVRAVQAVDRGSRYLASAFKQKLARARDRDPRFQSKAEFTERQGQVLNLLIAGHNMKKIAETLRITARTVAFHKYQLMAHIGAKSNMDLVRFAADRGMGDPN